MLIFSFVERIKVKYRILRKLKDATGNYVSGEQLGIDLDVSRTAIWKHIKELKKKVMLLNLLPKRL